MDPGNDLGDLPFPQSLVCETPVGYHRVSPTITPQFTLEGFPGQKSPYYIRIEVHECFNTISLPLTLFHSVSPHFTLPYFGAGVKWNEGE